LFFLLHLPLDVAFNAQIDGKKDGKQHGTTGVAAKIFAISVSISLLSQILATRISRFAERKRTVMMISSSE
jgi:hypothetical protein